jgi:acyl carrier protein
MLNGGDIKVIISSEIKGFDISNLAEDDNLFDAGIDSLDHMNILFAIQEKHGVNIPDEDVDNCSSIAEILSCIKKL